MQTIFFEDDHQVAIVDGAVTPLVGTIVELGNPNRDAVMVDVRLRVERTADDDTDAHGAVAVIVRARGLANTVPPGRSPLGAAETITLTSESGS